MSTLTCGACGMEIDICPDCGGRICTDGCVDRAEDGCKCEYVGDEKPEDDETV